MTANATIDAAMSAERAFKAGYEASMLDYALALQLRAKARGSIQMEEEWLG